MSESVETLTGVIRKRLSDSARVRRNIPGDGRLRVDRPLPFLTVYRYPSDYGDLGTVELVTTEAAYLFASGSEGHADDLERVGNVIKDHSLDQFDAFLLVEVWAETLSNEPNETLTHPSFKLCSRHGDVPDQVMEELVDALGEIAVAGRVATVKVDAQLSDVFAPPGMSPLIPSIADDDRCHHIGVAVHPIFRDQSGGTLYPLVLQSLRREFGLALRRAFFQFTAEETNESPQNVHTLGPTAFVQAATLVDQQLCDVSQSFDYILQITPVNGEQAWQEFKSSGFSETPKLYYRPLPRSPNELKQTLFDIPIDRIEDATLAQLFWEKQDELDRQITSLGDIDTPAFLYGSMQIYGEVEESLCQLAKSILATIPAEAMNPRDDGDFLTGKDLAKMAQSEIGRYREIDKTFNASVELRDDIASGIMVSKNKLLVSPKARVREARAQALMHHEIGTHVLTYFNGQGQPFQQLFAGLAGYESMQEGLAVLGEFLSGGLTKSRLQKLAVRVLAVQSLIDGATFPETFSRLVQSYGLSRRVAFMVTLRVFRAGGSTKDAIYLRGLRDVLRYLSDGNDFERLFLGKFALSHLPAIDELLQRQVLQPPRLLPRYLAELSAKQKLADCSGKSVINLIGA